MGSSLKCAVVIVAARVEIWTEGTNFEDMPQLKRSFGI